MLGGGEGDGGGSGDRAKGSDLITMHAVKKTSALVGTPMHFGFGSKSMQTDVQWSCTGTEPKWYWRTTEYSEEEEKEEAIRREEMKKKRYFFLCYIIIIR